MISVIIPTYNRQSTIRRAIESVLNQTYRDLELIIIDDCSSDQTRQIISEIKDTRLRYYCNEKNMGACASRNRGIDLAKGDYIAFQDSDDAWKTNKLEMQVKYMNDYNADVCFCRYERYVNQKSTEIIPAVKGGFVTYETLAAHSIVSTQTIFAKSFVFKNVRFDEELKRLQDYDWVVRAGLKYSFCLVDAILVDVYLQDDSITNVTKYEDTLEFLQRKYEKDKDKYKIVIPYILNKRANVKVYKKEKAVDLYLWAYKYSKNSIYLVKALISKLGLMRLLFKIRNISY